MNKDIQSGPIGLLSLLDCSYNPWVICAAETKSRLSLVEDDDMWFSAEEDDSGSDVEDDAMVSRIPFLPFEMVDEVILLVADGQDLINIITALFMTPMYHAFLAGDDYLWKRLLRTHYPHYVVCRDQKLLPTLIGLLRSFPNRMERPDHWGFCLDMERLSRAYRCPMSYSFMREERATGCRNVDWRLLKKMFDTECISCDSSPSISTPKDKWIINNLTNVVHSCQSINSQWVAAFYVFIEETFGELVSEYYRKYVMARSELPETLGRMTPEEKEHRERSTSLYIQEVMSRKEYGLYRFAQPSCCGTLPPRDRTQSGRFHRYFGAYS